MLWNKLKTKTNWKSKKLLKTAHEIRFCGIVKSLIPEYEISGKYLRLFLAKK